MKTRNGFVSNSSSSSFVIVTTEETLEKVLSGLEEEAREFVEEYFEYSKQQTKIDGKTKVVFLGEICTEDLEEGQNEIIDEFIDSFDNFRDSFALQK